MFKKISKLFVVLVVISLGFIYTEKAIYLVREYDPIMKSIKEVEDNFYIEAKPAYIEQDMYIPGVNGLEINLNKSYLNMKKNGIYDESLLVFSHINSNNYDNSKYISKTNQTKKEVSIIIQLDNNFYLNKLITLLNNKNIKVNFFVKEDTISSKDLSLIKSYGHHINYYTDKINVNTVGQYCLYKEKNTQLLEYCSDNKKISLLPSIIGGNILFTKVKANLEYGSVILIDNLSNLNQISITIDFIKQKGLVINLLEQTLNIK